jgi:alkaline phosphatase
MSSREPEPLLHRPPSQNSADTQHGLEEEDALLTGHRTGKQADTDGTSPRRKWREIGFFVWALLATIVVVVLAVVLQQQVSRVGGDPDDGNNNGGKEGGKITGKRNLIFMVSDGMGPTSLALTRSWRQYTEGLPWGAETLVLDRHLIGQSRTRSSSSLVTDSAAGATAFSCGIKSYNGAISVLPDHGPCGSVMEAAKRMGYTTGLVVTTRITDATPAVFVSHVRTRSMEDEIALQLIGETHPLGRMVDLVLGGGRCHFLGNETLGSCRADDVDVVETAKNSGWNYIDNRDDFDNLGTDAVLPLLGLFAGGDVPYEIDRRFQEEEYPSLEQMTRTALKLLESATQDSEQGFFVMIEGSRIDHAGHANDPAAQVHEVLAYDRAMSVVLDFIESTDVPTLMVSTSDHETGGLATARQLHTTYPEYLWYPSVLANATHSASYTAHAYHDYLISHQSTSSSSPEEETSAAKDKKLTSYLKSLLATSLGITDPSSSELTALITDPDYAAYSLAEMISRRAQLGWSTHGHSGADVNIYTSDPSLAGPSLSGNRENTDVGAFLRSFLDLDAEVEKVTRELRRHAASLGAVSEEAFLGPVPPGAERLDGQDHFEHYTGDHKMHRRGVVEPGACSCGL